MGLRADLRKAASAALSAVPLWAEEIGDRRRVARADDFIAKAAAQAAAAGNDGSHEPTREPKGLHFDPFDLVSATGYREKPSAVTFSALSSIAWTMPVVADIVRTRTNQAAMFARVPEDRHSPGFKVRLRDWRTGKVTKAVERRQQELERVLLDTGYVDAKTPWKAVPLEVFARQFIGDSLAFDQATFEIVPDRRGRPAYWSNVDASTIRLVDPGARSEGDVFAVQTIAGSIVADFKPEELAFCIRNPRTSVRSHGYGTSEAETLIREITGMLWGMEYNRRFFSHGSATKGILNFKGSVPEKHLQAFRRQWYSMVSGVNNSWRTPITNAEELQWISLQMSNRDMEYGAWMDFLIKIACARYQIAPEEVNFSYGNTGQSSAMGQPSNEEKLKASKDLGLRPLVRFLFTSLNQHVLWRIDPDFEAVPVGLDARGPEAEADLATKQGAAFLTIDEIREQYGLEPLGKDRGDCLTNPTWLQYVQGKEQAAMGGGGELGPDGQPIDPNAPPDDEEPASGGDFEVGDDDGSASGADFEVGDDDGEPTAKSLDAGRRVTRYEVDL